MTPLPARVAAELPPHVCGCFVGNKVAVFSVYRRIGQVQGRAVDGNRFFDQMRLLDCAVRSYQRVGVYAGDFNARTRQLDMATGERRQLAGGMASLDTGVTCAAGRAMVHRWTKRCGLAAADTAAIAAVAQRKPVACTSRAPYLVEHTSVVDYIVMPQRMARQAFRHTTVSIAVHGSRTHRALGVGLPRHLVGHCFKSEAALQAAEASRVAALRAAKRRRNADAAASRAARAELGDGAVPPVSVPPAMQPRLYEPLQDAMGEHFGAGEPDGGVSGGAVGEGGVAGVPGASSGSASGTTGGGAGVGPPREELQQFDDLPPFARFESILRATGSYVFASRQRRTHRGTPPPDVQRLEEVKKRLLGKYAVGHSRKKAYQRMRGDAEYMQAKKVARKATARRHAQQNAAAGVLLLLDKIYRSDARSAHRLLKATAAGGMPAKLPGPTRCEGVEGSGIKVISQFFARIIGKRRAERATSCVIREAAATVEALGASVGGAGQAAAEMAEAPPGTGGLNATLTVLEVAQACVCVPNNKVTGTDGMPGELYRYLLTKGDWWRVLNVKAIRERGDDAKLACSEFSAPLQALTAGLEAILSGREAIPRSWLVGVGTPLLKDGDREVVDNYRLIVAVSSGLKVFERVLHARLLAFLKSAKTSDSEAPECDGRVGLSDVQGGGRELRGCEGQVLAMWLALQAHVYRRVPAGQPQPVAHAVFVDVSKAFDTVDQALLWVQLRERYGIKGRVWSAVVRLYEGAAVRVRCNGVLGDEIPQRQGVRQGDVLSPLLYALWLDEAIQEVKKAMGPSGGLRVGGSSDAGPCAEGVRVPILGFCDDLVLMAEDRETLQRGLDALALFAAKFGFSFNLKPGKTAAMSFFARGEEQPEEGEGPGQLPCFVMPQYRETEGGELEVCGRKAVLRVQQYDYLGVPLRPVLTGAPAQHSARRKMVSGAISADQTVQRGKLGAYDHLMLLRVQVLPYLTYGLGVWGDVCGDSFRHRPAATKQAPSPMSMEESWRKAVTVAWGGSHGLPVLGPAAFLDAGLRTCVMYARQHRLRLVASCLAFGEGHLLHDVVKAALADGSADYEGTPAALTWAVQTRRLLAWLDEREYGAAVARAARLRGDEEDGEEEVARPASLLQAVLDGVLKQVPARAATDRADAREFVHWLEHCGPGAEAYRRLHHGGRVPDGGLVPAFEPEEALLACVGLRHGTAVQASGSQAARRRAHMATLRMALRSLTPVPAPRRKHRGRPRKAVLTKSGSRHARARLDKKEAERLAHENDCPGCGRAEADVVHLVLECPRFEGARAKLVAELRGLGPHTALVRTQEADGKASRTKLEVRVVALPPGAEDATDGELCERWGPVWLACVGAGLEGTGRDGAGGARLHLGVVHPGAHSASSDYLQVVLGAGPGASGWTARCLAAVA